MDRLLVAIALFTTCMLFIQAASVDNVDLLLRELESMEVQDRETQITKRVNDVMELLTSPIEHSGLFERALEGKVCEDGIDATCDGSVVCDDTGTNTCVPTCDSFSHGGKAHFWCGCKSDYTAQLCDVTKDEAEGKCRECKKQGGNYCYTTSGSEDGYFCYDSQFNVLTVSKRGLERRDDDEGERLGRIARVLDAYIRSAP